MGSFWIAVSLHPVHTNSRSSPARCTAFVLIGVCLWFVRSAACRYGYQPDECPWPGTLPYCSVLSITHFARKTFKRQPSANDKRLCRGRRHRWKPRLYILRFILVQSAVEGEVYALFIFSSLQVFLAMLKWEHNVTEEEEQGKAIFTKADRWSFFIFYPDGLIDRCSLLLNLHDPRHRVMIYYFQTLRLPKWGNCRIFIIGCLYQQYRLTRKLWFTEHS